MARPHKDSDDKRELTIRVRVTLAEKNLIWQRAQESGHTPSDFMRLKTIAGQPSRRVPTPEREVLLHLMAELGKIGGNVNQIARLLNRDGQGPSSGINPDSVTQAMASVDALTAQLLALLGHGH